MKKKEHLFWKITSKWYFWLTFLLLLILILNIIGNLRFSPAEFFSLTNLIFFLATIVGFAFGVLTLFGNGHTQISNLMFYVWSIAYYLIVVFTVIYISLRKKDYKLAIILLLLLFILSFAGCARVIKYMP